MKRLMLGEKVIGDYPDGWMPPEESDLFAGLNDGSMVYVDSPPEPVRVVIPQKTLVDQIISDPEQLAKLKNALAK